MLSVYVIYATLYLMVKLNNFPINVMFQHFFNMFYLFNFKIKKL